MNRLIVLLSLVFSGGFLAGALVWGGFSFYDLYSSTKPTTLDTKFIFYYKKMKSMEL